MANLSNVFKSLQSKFKDSVIHATNEYLQEVADEARRNAPTDDVAGAIFVIPARLVEDRIVGKVEIDLNIAPEAAAIEYGSGLHGESSSKYPIVPVNHTSLVFYWEKAYDYIPHTRDGRVILSSVMHPGVRARPYLNPAFDDKKEFYFNTLANLFRVDVGISVRENSD